MHLSVVFSDFAGPLSLSLSQVGCVREMSAQETRIRADLKRAIEESIFEEIVGNQLPVHLHTVAHALRLAAPMRLPNMSLAVEYARALVVDRLASRVRDAVNRLNAMRRDDHEPPDFCVVGLSAVLVGENKEKRWVAKCVVLSDGAPTTHPNGPPPLFEAVAVVDRNTVVNAGKALLRLRQQSSASACGIGPCSRDRTPPAPAHPCLHACLHEDTTPLHSPLPHVEEDALSCVTEKWMLARMYSNAFVSAFRDLSDSDDNRTLGRKHRRQESAAPQDAGRALENFPLLSTFFSGAPWVPNTPNRFLSLLDRQDSKIAPATQGEPAAECPAAGTSAVCVSLHQRRVSAVVHVDNE